MERVKDEVAALTLTAAGGSEVRFGSLWADRPAVVVFLRHFG